MSDEHHLPCKNIYEMHAEFNSMRDIAIQELEAILLDRKKYPDDEIIDPND